MSSNAPGGRDATASGRAETSVQQFLLGQAVDEGPALIFVADDQGRYAAVNGRVCETLGYTRAELLDMHVTDVAVAPDASELYETMVRQRAASGVTSIRCKDGRVLRFRYEASQVRVAHMEFWVSIGVIERGA